MKNRFLQYVLNQMTSRMSFVLERVSIIMVLLFCSILVGNGQVSQAQQVVVSGLVRDASRAPLPGVNVLVKGTAHGTVTDLDGRFTISVPSKEAVIVFSYVGFLPDEVMVGEQTEINIILISDIESLEEVVVVGYGVQKKATLTGSIEQVRSDVFEDRASSSPVLQLQGQSPGLVVTRGSSRPGNEDIGIKIRGDISKNGGDVLVIIDGIPSSSEEFYNMNSNDIESVSILKDGSAAIYGSRAANGVLLVNTKKGSGKLKVDYTGTFRLNTIGIRPPSPDMSEYSTVWLEAASQDDVPVYWGWQNEENLRLMQSNYEGIYPTAFWGDIYLGNNPRFEEMYGNSVSNQHDFSISGSTEKSAYRLSMGYAEDVGALKTAYDGRIRNNIRFSNDYQLTDWFKLETNIAYTNYHVSSPSTGLGSHSMAHDPPFFPAKNPYGQWYANFNIAGNRNSIAATVDGGRQNTRRDIYNVNIAAIFDIYKDLKFKASVATRKEYKEYQKYVVNVPQYTWYGERSEESVNSTSSITEERKNYNFENYNALLIYNKEKNGHSFSATTGITAELWGDNTLKGYRQGFEDNGVYDLNVGSVEENVEANGGAGHTGFYSYIARFNYGFRDKYLVELQGRRDGSSKFHDDFRWSNFFGSSVGWVVSEEAFMSDLPVVSFLKLRASYGEMGGQQGINMYDYISSIYTGTSVFGYNGQNFNSASVAKMTSFNRTWESISDLTFGVDFRLFNAKLQGAFDYFLKQNDGMFIKIDLPDVLGETSPPSNSGVMEAKGWEASLNFRDHIGKLEYSLGINMSDSRNTITNLNGANVITRGVINRYRPGSQETEYWIEGKPLNALYLFETDGLFADQTDVDEYYDIYGGKGELANLQGNNVLRPGDSKIVDRNGDDIINDEDLKYMGDINPHYVYGINLGLNWNGFDFSSFFQGVLNQKVLRSGYMRYPFATIWSNQTSAYIGETWTPENPALEYPRMTAYTDLAKWNWDNKDFTLQNNRYMRLKSLVFGYTFKDIKISKYNLNKLRLYFSGSDLFEFTSVKDGYDPENGESTQSAYPFVRTWSLGLNLGF